MPAVSTVVFALLVATTPGVATRTTAKPDAGIDSSTRSDPAALPHLCLCIGSLDGLTEQAFGAAAGADDPAGQQKLRPFHIRLATDIHDLALKPSTLNRRRWLHLGAGALAVGTVSVFDEDIRNAVRSGSDGSQKFARNVRPLGEEAGLAFLGVNWLVGSAFHRPESKAIATDGAEATLLSAGLVAPLLKSLVGRDRPRDSEDAYSFDGGKSFPSGEVAEAFTIASVVAAHTHRRWVKGLAWGLSGLTGWERIELDGHWGSDVLAGALIGAGMGRWVVHRNRPDLRKEGRWTMLPELGDNAYGVGFRRVLGAGAEAPHAGSASASPRVSSYVSRTVR